MDLMDKRHRKWVVVLAVLQAVLIYVRVHKSTLFSDDFLNFELYDERGFNLRYLFLDVFGQIAPGYRAVQALTFELFGPNFAAAATIIGCVSVACTILLAGLWERLGASGWAIICGLLIFIGLPQFTQTQQWWAAAVHTIFSLAAILVSLYCIAGTSRNRIVIACFWYGVALCFTAKVVCSPVIIGAVVYFQKSRANGGDIKKALWEACCTLVPFAVLTAVYLAGVALYGPNIHNPKPSGALLAHYIWENVATGTVAATFGMDAWGLGIPSIVPVLGVIALAGISIYKSRRISVLWAASLTYMLAAAVIIGLNRAGTFPDAGATLRYGVEGSTFLVLTCVMAISSFSVPKAGQAIAVALGILTLINVQAHLRNRVLIAYPIAETRHFLKNLKGSLAKLDGERDVVIQNGMLPGSIMPSWMGSAGEIKRFLHLFSNIEVGDARYATHRLDTDGTIRPIEPTTPR